jgi:hypothetical protein
MANRLSHSQVSKYQQCGKAYQFWYINKIRPTKSRSALLFGSALDRAIGVLLNPSEEQNKTPEQLFEYFWRFQDINGKKTYIPTCTSLVYSKSDFDKDLLSNEDAEKVGKSREELIALADKRNEFGYDRLSEEEKAIINHAFWFCLQRKGLYMIKAFREKVMPKIRKVHSTQEYIELNNDDGDKVIGYIDIVAEVDGHSEPIVLDLKTSAMEYEEDAVLTSPQLTLYTHAVSEKYKTRKAGFIVLNKNLMKNRKKICSKCNHDGSGGRHKTCANEIEGKRCGGEWTETISPEVYVQFIIDEIPEQTENLVLENIADINTAIKTGHFTRNLSMCTNTYGGPCDYLFLCYKGKMDNLVKQGE